MSYKLAILIPTTPDRQQLTDRLIKELTRQIGTSDVRIVLNEDNYERTTGTKRNELVQHAVEIEAQVIAFHDSDDMPGPTYIKRGLEVVESGLDCGELWGNYYEKGKLIKPFHHYLGCTHAWDDKQKFHRFPNHLNFMKLSLVKDFKFQDKTFGEDMTWAEEIMKAGVLKTMYNIPEVIYHYFK